MYADKPKISVTTDLFLSSITKVLSCGHANSTLKWALLLGLIETAPRFVRSPNISLEHVAESVLQVYQRHSRKFPALGKVLRQTSGGKNGLSILDTFGSNNQSNDGERAAGLAWTLAQWPVPRLQFVDRELMPFLYEVPESWSDHIRSKGSNRPLPRSLIETDENGLPVLRPLSGAIEALIKVGPLLRHSIEFRWIVQIARINRISVDPEIALREFLFPSESRMNFDFSFRAEMHALQGGQCFWCERQIDAAKSVFDHVVPWSISRNDAIENLVLTDSKCNQTKSSHLPDTALTVRWLKYLQNSIKDLAAVAEKFSIRSDPITSRAWMRSQYYLMAEHSNNCLFTVFEGRPAVVRFGTEDFRTFADSAF